MIGRRDWQLPQLSGWVLTGYRVLMVALLLIALPGLRYEYQQQSEAQDSANAAFAAGLRFPGGNGTVIRLAPLSDEARAQRLKPGDRLIAIDGRKFPVFDFDAMEPLLAGPDGSRFTLTIQTGEDAPRTITLTRNAHYLERAYAGSGLTFAGRSWTVFGFKMLDALLAMATALLLLIRRSRDPVAAMLAISAVPLGDGLTYLWPDAGALLYGFYILRNMLFLTALLTFPDGRFVPKWALWVTPAIPVIGFLSVQAVTVEAAIAPRQILTFAFLCFALGAFLFRYRSTRPGLQRQQIKFVLLGAAAWLGFGFVSLLLEKASNASLTAAIAAWFSLSSHLASSVAAIAFECGILVSLLRYRLYDADSLIGRSAGYAFLTLLLGAIFSGTEKMVQVMGQQFFGESAHAMSAGFGAAIAATSIAPLNKRIHRWAEHRFQQRLAVLRNDLPKAVSDLRVVATFDLLLASVLKRIQRGVRSSHAAVILWEEDGDIVRTAGLSSEEVIAWRRKWRPNHGAKIESDRADPLLPLRLPLRTDGATIIGWILLGPRPDGSFYGKDEREALAAVADPIARAIAIVRERDARIAQDNALREALEQRIVLLETRLDELAINPVGAATTSR